jgi:predicted Na+-dependent transporter
LWCCLPRVQSRSHFLIAGGNVPAAVCASASNVFAVFHTHLGRGAYRLREGRRSFDVRLILEIVLRILFLSRLVSG